MNTSMPPDITARALLKHYSSKKQMQLKAKRELAKLFILQGSWRVSIYDSLLRDFIDRVAEKRGIALFSSIQPMDVSRLRATRNLFVCAELKCSNRKQIRTTLLRTLQCLLILAIVNLSVVVVESAVDYAPALLIRAVGRADTSSRL